MHKQLISNHAWRLVFYEFKITNLVSILLQKMSDFTSDPSVSTLECSFHQSQCLSQKRHLLVLEVHLISPLPPEKHVEFKKMMLANNHFVADPISESIRILRNTGKQMELLFRVAFI
jgi:hypothetical protein